MKKSTRGSKFKTIPYVHEEVVSIPPAYFKDGRLMREGFQYNRRTIKSRINQNW